MGILGVETYHPAVIVLYFAGVLVCVMCGLHPVVSALGMAGGVACGACLRGFAKTLRALVWQIPLLVIICVINPLMNAAGSHVLLRAWGHVIYFESVIYGLSAGMLLVATMAWFTNAAAVITSEACTSLFAKRFPIVGTMTTMTIKLVPHFVQRGREMREVERACTARKFLGGATWDNSNNTTTTTATATAKSRANKKVALLQYARLAGSLMSWGMEDALQTSQSMKARAWGAWECGCERASEAAGESTGEVAGADGSKHANDLTSEGANCINEHAEYVKVRTRKMRTSYAQRPLNGRAILQLCVLSVLIFLSLACNFCAMHSFQFYPALNGFADWYMYAPYVVFLGLPSALIVVKKMSWAWREREQ